MTVVCVQRSCQGLQGEPRAEKGSNGTIWLKALPYKQGENLDKDDEVDQTIEETFAAARGDEMNADVVEEVFCLVVDCGVEIFHRLNIGGLQTTKRNWSVQGLALRRKVSRRKGHRWWIKSIMVDRIKI